MLRVHSQLFAPQGHCVIGTHGNGVAQGAVGEWCIFVTVNIQSHLYAIMEGERGWQDRFNYSHFLLHFATIRHLFNGHFLTHFATFVSLCKFSHQSAWPKNGATGWKVGSVAFGAMALKNCRRAENVVPCPALLNWYCSSHVLRRLTFRNLSDQG